MGVFSSKSESEIVRVNFLDGHTNISRTDCSPYLLQFVKGSEIHVVCDQAEGRVCIGWFLGNKTLGSHNKTKLNRIRQANLYFRCSGLDDEIDLLLKPKDQSTQTYDNPNDVD